RSLLVILLEIMATVVGCVGIVILRNRLRSYGGQAIVFAYAGLLLGTSLFLFDMQRMILDPSASIAAMLILYLVFIGIEIVATQRERRRTDEARRTALVLAESASHAKSNFLTGMSHELRTPLNAIIGFSEMIKDGVLGPVSPPNYATYAKDINSAAVHLLGVVTQILDMANLESGEMRLRITEFPLKDLLDESIEAIRSVRSEDRVRIIIIEPAVLPTLRADRRMVKQMLLNLLLNAAKFSPDGGTVRIAVVLASNGDLLLSVTDSGSGMSQKQVAAAFEIFQSSDQTLSDSTRGIGLGLPITTAMIEEHGGAIDVVSGTGKGTKMTLRIPANRVVQDA
ncbi:MAG: HAMP domain-containing sensor histidine kinase, partial [Rhodospirillaceae bacterium]|nr:HAMP domain-containing sensor histidine kinase [Rhodospirillaceae bacterium]